MTTKPHRYPAGIFNRQQLLFDTTRLVKHAGTAQMPWHYYEHGWAVFDHIDDEMQAIQLQENLINDINEAHVPLQKRFHNRIQLAKADQIPVCDDIVATSFQVLHFDMGHPLVESKGQLFVSHVGIYLPKTTEHEVTARTRLVELDGLLAHSKMSPDEIETKATNYARRFGDGWTGHNTYRLACFVRFLDALGIKPELGGQIDKTVGQWFQNSDKTDEESAYQNEAAFYAKHGINLAEHEHHIALRPGQLLLLDNTRVIHGRIGKRRAKELFNFMFGIQAVTPKDIAALRQFICGILV